MNILPPNPNADSPERPRTVCRRIAVFAGGLCILGGNSLMFSTDFPTEHPNVALVGIGTIFTSIWSLALPLAHELGERFAPPDSGDHGDNGPWRNGPDDEPPKLPPTPEGGLVKELLPEVEDFLSSQQPVSVA